MGWIGWIGLMAGLIALAYFGVTIASSLLPSRSVAVTMICNELRRQELAGISEPSIVALADHMVHMLQIYVRHGLKKGPNNSLLEDEARVICMRVYNIVTGDDNDVEKIRKDIAKGMPDQVWQILAKHQPEFFSIENLEKTQVANSLLREAHNAQLRERRGSKA